MREKMGGCLAVSQSQPTTQNNSKKRLKKNKKYENSMPLFPNKSFVYFPVGKKVSQMRTEISTDKVR